MRYPVITALAALLTTTAARAQYAPPDPAGFQGLIVETYYIADAADAADPDGGPGLVAGARTYRVFADMLPGYKLVVAGGFENHPLTISTSTSFFNNDDRGEAWGRDIPGQHVNKNTVAIDSWLAFGAASTQHWGVMKTEDTNGTLVGGSANQSGLLANTDAAMGIPLTQADGLINIGTPPTISYVGTAPDLFDPGGGNSFSNDNFAWSVLGGIAGPTPENRVLLGQFTTDGELQFCFNVWVKLPDSLVCPDPFCHTFMEFYPQIVVADTLGQGYAGDRRFAHPTLCFNSSSIDCTGIPNGPNTPGSPCDDGNPDTSNDAWDAQCLCLGQDCAGVPGGSALPGSPCDDGNPATVNDTWQPGCICSGSVGIAEAAGFNGVAVRPNPTADALWVDVDHATGGKAVIELLDLTGRALLALDLGSVPARWQHRLDIAHFARGSYLLAITMDGQRHVERIGKL